MFEKISARNCKLPNAVRKLIVDENHTEVILYNIK